MKSLLNKMDKIYCINLDSRVDRWEQATKVFSEQELEVTRMSGVLYHGFTEQKRNACVGNHLSHARCLMDAKNSGAYSCLIFEDDVTFFYDRKQTNIYISEVCEELPTDWDILYLGANVWAPAHKVSPRIARLTAAYATHAYIVNNTMYDKLIEINTNIEIYHNDVYYSDHIIPNYNVYITIPLLCGQADGYSTIEGKYISYNDMFLQRFRANLMED